MVRITKIANLTTSMKFDCVFLTLCNTRVSVRIQLGSQFSPKDRRPAQPHLRSFLMNSISYVVAALLEPALCLPASNTLRDLGLPRSSSTRHQQTRDVLCRLVQVCTSLYKPHRCTRKSPLYRLVQVCTNKLCLYKFNSFC